MVTAEFLVYWMHRMDDDYEMVKDHGMCPQLNLLPSEYVKRNCYITCEVADADKIQAVEADDFDAKGFAEKTQEYQKLFLR
jgi:hypothetical protein